MRAPARLPCRWGGRGRTALDTGSGGACRPACGGCGRVRMRQTPPGGIWSASKETGTAGGRTACVLAGWAWRRAMEWGPWNQAACGPGGFSSASVHLPCLPRGAQTPRGLLMAGALDTDVPDGAGGR